MSHSGCIIWILLSSWAGIVAANVKILPHVSKYQRVKPQRLNGKPIFGDAPPHERYPDELQYYLSIEGKNYTLYLEKNRNLVGENYTVTSYSDDGVEISSTSDEQVHCFYHGHIVEVKGSSASIGLCSGMTGFVTLRNQMYLIEPLASDKDLKPDDHQNPGTPNDEGLHAVYNYKHLRRKRSSCSHGNTTTYYDHGARPSGLLQLGSLRSRAQIRSRARESRIVELAVVVDNTEYKKFGSKKRVEARVLEIANHLDKLYRPVAIRVMLVAVVIWSHKDQIEVSANAEDTLLRFLEWRQQNLVPNTKHDNAQFITGVDFLGSTVGLANRNAICTSSSGAVNQDHNTNSIGVASTITHELGHNLGLSHDTEDCLCGSVASKTGCIMAESVGTVYPEHFSSCSKQQLHKFLEEYNPACLLDTPSTDRIYGGPVCGNAFVEPGEDCDCGTAEECTNPCCNATTCKLSAGAQCAEGECCHDCQLKPSGSVCRAKAGDCDLTEFCTGSSARCPADTFTQNGLSCNRGRGYCYNGECPSRREHCKKLWGPEAEVAADECFLQRGKCGKFGYKCSFQDQFCGTLFCSGGWEFPVTSMKSYYTIGNGVTCNEATMKPEDNYPSDLGMVPAGTKCGNNMVCFNGRCQDMRRIKAYGRSDCSSKCSNHGVCNHEGKCHCDPGWAPPFCDMQQLQQIQESSIVAVAVSAVIGLFLLSVLIVGTLKFYNNRKPHKRRHLTSSGQSNPVFRSSGRQANPCFKSTIISQPVFVASSATRSCKPLFSAVNHQSGGRRPYRAAPKPPKTILSNLQQSLTSKTFTHHAAVSKVSVYSETKPLPPSRPLPPLAAKPVTRGKYPALPEKPKPSAARSSLPHTQLVAGRVVLMPPSRPR